MILRKLTAGSGKKLSLELGGKSPVVVFDSADLDSAVEGIVQAIWFNQGQVIDMFLLHFSILTKVLIIINCPSLEELKTAPYTQYRP